MSLPFIKAERWLDELRSGVDLNRISTPIMVIEEEQIEIPSGRRKLEVGQYDFRFKFPGTHGGDLDGNGRLFIPTRRPKERMPILVSMHYEIDANGASRFLRKGIAVITPHGPRSYIASNLLGHGVNHSISMARLPRRMPFIDQNRVVLFGGSAGGYHALMASSFVFPLTAVFAAVPPLNLKYNINYIVDNDRHNRVPGEPDQPAAPVVRAVLEIGAKTADGGKPGKQTWKHFSPVFRTDLMTFPTVMTFVTADALVPICQLSKDLVQKPPPGMWPEGFSFDMDEIIPDPGERASLMDVLTERDCQLRIVRTPENTPTIDRTRDQMTPDEISRIPHSPLEWSRKKRFSIHVLDEGPPEPFCGHAKYHHSVDDSSFFEYHFTRGILEASILTLRKLVQLMKRFKGIDPELGHEYGEDGVWAIKRRDNPSLERWYVAHGLEVFAGGEGNAKRLVNLYRMLPAELKALDLGGAGGEFAREPVRTLLYHQLTSSVECGDLELARHLMRRLLSKGAA